MTGGGARNDRRARDDGRVQDDWWERNDGRALGMTGGVRNDWWERGDRRERGMTGGGGMTAGVFAGKGRAGLKSARTVQVIGYGSMYTTASPFMASVPDWFVHRTASFTMGLSSRTDTTSQLTFTSSPM